MMRLISIVLSYKLLFNTRLYYEYITKTIHFLVLLFINCKCENFKYTAKYTHTSHKIQIFLKFCWTLPSDISNYSTMSLLSHYTCHKFLQSFLLYSHLLFEVNVNIEIYYNSVFSILQITDFLTSFNSFLQQLVCYLPDNFGLI